MAYGTVSEEDGEAFGGIVIDVADLGVETHSDDQLWLSSASTTLPEDEGGFDQSDLWDFVTNKLQFPTSAHYKGKPIPIQRLLDLYQKQNGVPMPGYGGTTRKRVMWKKTRGVTAESIAAAAIALAQR